MHIGILTNTFDAKTPEDTVAALHRHGIYHVQLELPSVGLPSLPDQFDGAAKHIGRALADGGIHVATVSGTFNMIHPNPAERQLGLRRLNTLAEACAELGAPAISLCSGTRDTTSMWRWHADSYTRDAWQDVLVSVREAARIGEAHGVIMAVEPEVNNAVDSARKARRLLDEVGSPRLKIIMDGANVFHTGELPRMREVLEETFALLGPDIAFAHAKDLDHDGDAGHLPAGHGLLDYGLYLSLLKQAQFDGVIVLHGLSENDVDGCVAFLRKNIDH